MCSPHTGKIGAIVKRQFRDAVISITAHCQKMQAAVRSTLSIDANPLALLLKQSGREAVMVKKWAAAIATATVLAVGSSAPAFAQLGAVGDAVKGAGQATAEGTKKAVEKTGQVTKDAAKETASGTKKATERTKEAVTPQTTTARCKDGTVQKGKTKTTACMDHGGVK
jgi:hypothetical protein